MERKEVDFKLSVLSDWSLSGFIRSFLDDVTKDLELDDKYDVDFLAKFETTRKNGKMYFDTKQSHANCSQEFNHSEKERGLLKPGGDNGERDEVATEQERLVYFYGVRQEEFGRLIKALDNQRSTEISEEKETKDVVVKENESPSKGGLNNVEVPLESSHLPEVCILEKVAETPTVQTETVEVVKNKTKINIFRRIAKLIRGFSCCSKSAVQCNQ